jgi:RNA polymerase sigma factor (sigma-70 family)
MASESVAQLLRIISRHDQDVGQANEAFACLYVKYARLLFGLAEEGDWNRYGIDGEELVMRTFEKAWNKAGSFDAKKSYPKSSEDAAVKLWLITILKNEFRDALRSVGRKSLLDSLDQEVVDGILDLRSYEEAERSSRRGYTAEATSQYKRLLAQWMETLSLKDREIMKLSSIYISPRTGRCEIPPDELKGLAVLIGVAPATIKVKRQRLIERFKTYVLENQ